MRTKRNLLMILCLGAASWLPPAQAQVFNPVFGNYKPYYFADVNDDGKLEYLYHDWDGGASTQWRSLDGQTVIDFGLSLDYNPSDYGYRLDYLNADPVIDFISATNPTTMMKKDSLLLSKDGKYTHVYNAAFNTYGASYGDVNLDGRMDILTWLPERNNQYKPYFLIQREDGSFMRQAIPLVTDSAQLAKMQYAKSGNGAFSVSGNSFSGLSHPDKGRYSKEPLAVVDLNLDGYPDFLDTKGGNSFISLADGRYYTADLNGQVAIADVNGDGLSDLIIYKDGEVTLRLSDGMRFQETSLLKNHGVKGLYALDADGDGRTDILVTLTGSSDTDYSYLAFFHNNGDGSFKRTVRSAEGSVQWTHPYFVNNNGIPSVFSIRHVRYPDSNNPEGYSEMPQVVRWDWDAQFSLTATPIETNRQYVPVVEDFRKLFIADYDGDGLSEILYSDLNFNSVGYDRRGNCGLYKLEAAKANTPPAAMSSPNVALDKSTGMARIDWPAGNDAENAPGDLTYELEITSDNEYLYRTFTNKLFAIVSAGVWGKESIRVKVRAIDASGMKGPWSDWTALDGIAKRPSFVMSHREMNNADTLTVTSIDGHDFTLTLYPEGEILRKEAGMAQVRFTTVGDKTVSVTSADGITAKAEVKVNPFCLEPAADTGEDYTFFDLDQDGLNESVGIAGFFKWQDGLYVKQPVFDFADCGPSGKHIFDLNMNGRPDIYVADTRYSGNAINLGGMDFEKSSQNFTVDGVSLEQIESSYQRLIADINNDGLQDFILGYDIYLNNGDGTLTKTRPEVEGYAATEFFYQAAADFDKDGRIDLKADFKDEATGEYRAAILFNDGGNKFTPCVLNRNFTYYHNPDHIGDVNGDGYEDIFSIGSISNSKETYAFINQKNRTFNAGSIMEEGIYIPLDIDNDGLPDYGRQLAGKTNFLMSHNGLPYVYETTYDRSAMTGNAFNDTNNDGIPDPSTYSLVARNLNTPPSAPSRVVANQRQSEVVIEWSGAADKETPYGQLRYNISIREKGKEGNGSYIWSPLNQTSDLAKTSPTGISTYYRQATVLPMPTSRFKAGTTYEIQIQAIDRWGEHSPFSKAVAFTPTATTLLTLPSKAGVGQAVAYTVVDNTQGDITLDTDGGTLTGRQIVWDTPGLKTVTAHSGTTSSTAQVMVADRPDLKMNYPAKLLAGQTVTLPLPEIWRDGTADVSISSSIPDLQTDRQENTMTFTVPATDERPCIQLHCQLDEWKEVFVEDYHFTVVGQDWKPVIDKVTVAEGRNRIVWTPGQPLPQSDLFTGRVKIYRERDMADLYECIGEANLSDGSFMDENSRPGTRSDRYMITLPTVYGMESGPSAVHASVHLMVNKGMGNDINLHWSAYEGADVVQYEIYAGTSPSDLKRVESLSGHSRSYVHHRSQAEGTTYYAVAVRLKNEINATSHAPAAKGTPVSNIISSEEAYGITPVTGLRILVHDGPDTFSEQVQTLYLQAEATPAQATLTSVEWSLAEGEELVNLSADGTLTVKAGTPGGSATVQAKAIDGSGKTATRTFLIPASAGITPATAAGMPAVITSSHGQIQISHLMPDTHILVTSLSGAVVYRAVTSHAVSIPLASGCYVVKAGKTIRKIVVR